MNVTDLDFLMLGNLWRYVTCYGSLAFHSFFCSSVFTCSWGCVVWECARLVIIAGVGLLQSWCDHADNRRWCLYWLVSQSLQQWWWLQWLVLLEYLPWEMCCCHGFWKLQFFSLRHICDTEKAVSSLGQRLTLGSMVEHNIWWNGFSLLQTILSVQIIILDRLKQQSE